MLDIISLNNHSGSGTAVAGSEQHFLPFGELRHAELEQLSHSQLLSATGVTDRGFTGHKENRGIGLTFMNARYYLSSIGRFASADTIIPDPGSSQAYNRYAYVSNNPLRFIDTTGYCEENALGSASGAAIDVDCWDFAQQISDEYDIPLEFLGSMTLAQMRFFIQGINETRGIDNDLADEILVTINGLYPQELDTISNSIRGGNINVIGIRLSASAGVILGGSGDIDFIWNFASWEFSIIVSLGMNVGATLEGLVSSAGFFMATGAPNNDVFQGGSWNIVGEISLGAGAYLQYSDNFAKDNFAALSFGLAAGAGGSLAFGYSYGFELLRINSAIGETGNHSITRLPRKFYNKGLAYDQPN